MPDVFFDPCEIEVPFMKTVNQTFEPSSVDDHASETCVGPTSVSETAGLVGGVVSRGSVNVTELLYPEALPAASTPTAIPPQHSSQRLHVSIPITTSWHAITAGKAITASLLKVSPSNARLLLYTSVSSSPPRAATRPYSRQASSVVVAPTSMR